MMISALLVLSLLAQPDGTYAPQRQGSEPLAPALEARAQSLGKKLRCTVCQGLSISDSPSSSARAQLDKVRELVAAGKTDEEVFDFFVSRYGEWALLSPKPQGLNLLVWVGPVMILLLGLGLIFALVRGGAGKPAGLQAAEPSGAADDPYLERVRAELDR